MLIFHLSYLAIKYEKDQIYNFLKIYLIWPVEGKSFFVYVYPS